MSEEGTILKSCPFCGGKAEVGQITEHYTWAGLFYIGCVSSKDGTCPGNIDKHRPLYASKKSAIAAWNRREREGE